MKSFMGGPGLMGGSEEEGREISEGCKGKMSFPAFSFITEVRATICLCKVYEHIYLDFGCACFSSIVFLLCRTCFPTAAMVKKINVNNNDVQFFF